MFSPTHRRPGIAAAFVLVALSAAAAGAQEAGDLATAPRGTTFAGSETPTVFPTEVEVRLGDRSWLLAALGSGTRRQLLFKVYEGAVYADREADLGTDPAQALIEGAFVRQIVLKFVRDVTGDKVREAVDEGFSKVLVRPSPQLLEDKERLLGYFAGGLTEGETIELTWIPGTGLFTHVGGAPKPVLRNEALARAIMEIWFGDRPVAEDLKRNMLRFVPGR